MKKYLVTFCYERRNLNWTCPVDESSKKTIEKAFMKGKKINGGYSVVDLSKCLYVLFEEVE